MPDLTINTRAITGQVEPNAPFTITLIRQGAAAQGLVYGATGVVADPEYAGTTSESGQAVVPLAGTASFNVQTFYRLRLGTYTGQFTMPATDANLVDRLVAEDVTVAQGGGGGGLSTGQVQTIVRQELTTHIVSSDSTLNGDGNPSSQLMVAVPLTSAEKTKIAGIDAGAQVNVGQPYTALEKAKVADIGALGHSRSGRP